MQSGQRVTGDCINASFQGFFDSDALEQGQELSGTGIVLDDDLNLFISNWKNHQLDGPSVLRVSNNQLICGNFDKGKPDGAIAIHSQDLSFFGVPCSPKGHILTWQQSAVAVNNKLNLVYVLDIKPKNDIRSSKKDQLETVPLGRSIQWKVTIVERCPLKSDGALGVQSSVISNRQQSSSRSNLLTRRDKNIADIVRAILGDCLIDERIINPVTFVKDISKSNERIEVRQLTEGDIDMVLLHATSASESQRGQKVIGLLLLGCTQVDSVGWYDKSMRLQGPGLQMTKSGQAMVGYFKEGMLVKQWSLAQLRKWLANEHLRSLSHINQCFYVQKVGNMADLGRRVSRYVEAFQREFQKRNLNFNDTPMNNSTTHETHNIRKYMQPSRTIQLSSSPSHKSSQSNLQSGSKRPGFIRKKQDQHSCSRSRSKSPGMIINRNSNNNGFSSVSQPNTGSIRSTRHYSYLDGLQTQAFTHSKQSTSCKYR